MPPTGLAFLTTTTLFVSELLSLPPPDRATTNATTSTTRASPSRLSRWFLDKLMPPSRLLGDVGSAEDRRSAAREVAGEPGAAGRARAHPRRAPPPLAV